jgi:hypothetical protein
VDAAEFFGRKIDHPLHVRVFRHVGADERRFAGKFLNLSDDLCPFFFATAGQYDFCTSRANSSAVALPIPDVPPVTSATLPENVLLFMELVFRCLLFSLISSSG